MCRSFSFVFTLLFLALSLMTATCAPAETRATYPNTFFRKKSTPSYSAKATTDYKPVPTVTYKPTVPSVTTYKPTTIVTVLPTTTYKPVTSTQSKAPIVASYAKNTFFKSKTSSGKPTEAPAVMKYTPPSAGNDIQPDPLDKGKTSGLYANTFFKKKPKASETNYDKATTAATTTKSVVISPVKISEPVSEGDVKPAKKVSYTNTYFKAKPAIVSTQVPALLDNHAAKLSSNDSSSEESSEELGHALGSTSETSEESSEEEGTSEENEEASQEGEEQEEGNESNEEEKKAEDDEKIEAKKEDDEKGEKEEDEKAVKKEESKDKVLDVTFVQKATLPPPRPTVSSVPIVHEKKDAKPVFLAFKKMRSKPNSA